MSHIFVSYKRENLDEVELLVNELKRHHYVWFDKTGIPGGAEWEAKINTALDESATLILMVTPNALKSEWVQYEYQKALSKGVLVIPFMLEDCQLPPDLGGRQKIFGSDTEAFEKLIDALPDKSRIWGDITIPQSELLPQRTFSQLAKLCSGGLLQPAAQLIGIPIKQTRYCKVYLVGKHNDTLEPLDRYQLALQLTSRNFSLATTADGSYPQDEFARDIATHFLTSPSKQIRLYLVQGPLSQPYDHADRLSFGLNIKRSSEWSDVVQAADYARGIAKGKLMQLFVNGPAIMTYKLGVSNPGFSRYELYQLDYSGTGYYCVLQG